MVKVTFSRKAWDSERWEEVMVMEYPSLDDVSWDLQLLAGAIGGTPRVQLWDARNKLLRDTHMTV